jgi:hypothetical protein
VAGVSIVGLGPSASAAAGDSSNSLARFLSGSLLTSSGTLDSLAALAGETATSSGAADDIQTGSLDISALSTVGVTLPGGASVPLGTLLQLGLANQYAEADANGLSRAAAGAVSNTGVVDTTGTGGFPSDATLNIASILPSAAQSVLTTANLDVGAISGVAALDPTVSGGPTTSCSSLSSPVNCRDYTIANASLNLASPAIGTAVSSINTTLGTASTAVNGLQTSLLSSLNGVINGLGVLTGGANTLAVTVNVDLQQALSTVLQSSISSGGVTLDLANGTITVDLATILGGLHQPPNTPLLSSTVINAVVSSLSTILSQLQTTINATATTALDNAAVTISGGVCDPLGGCAPPLGGTLSIGYTGTLADLASGTAAITASGTGTIPGLLGLTLTTLGGTIATTLGSVAQPVLSSAISTVSTGTANALTTLSNTLDPALQAISSTVGATLNVQEPGTATGSYREVALRISLLGGTATTIDLGRAEVGPNVVAVAPTIASLSPNQGPAAGGTSVTITGTGFTGTTAVTFGGTPATSFTVDSDTQITAVAPANNPGAVDVVVTNPAGPSAPQTFTYLPAPTITSLTPNQGPEAGGTSVTITGTGFTGTTGVTFGGTPATSFVVDSDTTISAITPAHTAGAVPTVVTAPGGDSAPQTFTYLPSPPTIGSLSPNQGPDTGGTTVTITGTNFTGTTAVTFGGTPATSFAVDSDTTITAVTPPHSAGGVPTIVTNSAGPSAPQTFTYLPTPTVTSLSPNQGPAAGGTSVTITGTTFTGATAVTFGGTAATSFIVNSDTSITAITPANAPGAVDVIVTTPVAPSPPQTFTYLPAPTITSLAPDHGPDTGGTAVTITGTNVTGATAVTFGGIPAASFTVDSATQITAITPPNTPGAVDVVVTTAGGDSAPQTFTYLAAPVATTLSPTHGPLTGGTTVTIDGSGFTQPGLAVDFGGTPVTPTVDSDIQITVLSPPGTVAGPVNVVVTTDGGTATALPFIYDPVSVPQITTPTGGSSVGSSPAIGGTSAGLDGDTITVTEGGTTICTATLAGGAWTCTPASPLTPGGHTITAAETDSGDHTSSPSTPVTFTVLSPAPTISSLDPAQGPDTGATLVTVTGTGFADGDTVTIGGTTIPANQVAVLSPTQLTFSTPAHAAGGVTVVVSGPGGDSGPLPYTYTTGIPSGSAPTITTLAPDHGPLSGGTTVTIDGSGFTQSSVVLVDLSGPGGTTTVSVTPDSISEGSLTFTTPAGLLAGPSGVRVSNGPTADSSALTYTYDPPAVTATSPAHPGGTTVVAGAGWPPADTLTVELVDAHGTVVSGPMALTTGPDGTFSGATLAVPAAASDGTYQVRASDAAGNRAAAPVTVTTSPSAPGAPTLTGIHPASGPTAGGQQVTLTGTGFGPDSTVTIGGKTVTPISVSTDGTSLVFVTPVAPAGGVTVTVSNGPGLVSGAVRYTYVAPGITATSPVTAGGSTTVTGSCWPAGDEVDVRIVDVRGHVVGTPETFVAAADCSINGTLPVPLGTAAGSYTVQASDTAGNSASTGLTIAATPAIPQPTAVLRYDVMVQGSSIDNLVTGSHWQPGIGVSVVLHSDPINLGQAVPDAEGGFSMRFSATGLALGHHTVTLSQTRTDGTVATIVLSFEVVTSTGTGGSLVNTGAPVSAALVWALTLFVAGTVLLVGARRRRRRQRY